MARTHQLHLRDLGRVYQYRAVLPANEAHYTGEYELRGLCGGVYCGFFLVMVVDFGEKVWFITFIVGGVFPDQADNGN